jgi:hypothetical protein
MKKIITIALVLAMMLVLIPAGSVFAAKEATVTITMTGGTLSIAASSTPSPYDFGPVVQDETYASDLIDFTVTNDGTVQADIDIHGAGSTSWTLVAATGNPDEYALNFQRSLVAGWNPILTTDNDYMDDLNSGNSDDFGVQLLTPTTITIPQAETAVITLTASQSLVAGSG